MDRSLKVGLALGGGVVRGLAHVGVLAVLEQAHIPIHCVAGTSAGAIIGAAYCAGLEVETIRQYALGMRWWHIARPVWPRYGFVNFDMLAHWMRRVLGDLEFKDLKLPYAAVATDLETGEPVHLREGRLAPAVQASCSVPGFVTPVHLDGRVLGDGSLSDTIPVGVLRQMGADYVIGVDIFPASIRRRLGPVGMGLNALEILVQRAGGGLDQADCLVAPDLSGFTYLRFSKREDFFLHGERATLEKLGTICHDLGLALPERPIFSFE